MPKNTSTSIKTKLYSGLQRFEIDANTHGLSNKDFDPNALQTVKTLEKHGHMALIVGGAIRDLLCGIKPKDFDIATSAKPHEMKGIFKNSRIIGRRFKIIHLYFGREVLELATFRAQSNNTGSTEVNQQGQVIRDNTYGTIEDDAQRRDFSANSLYYSPTTQKIYDFTGGFEAIKGKQLRILGIPEERFNEDPVRMLRAYRFATKLNFRLENNCIEAIEKQKHLLLNISNARMFDETIKLLHTVESQALTEALIDAGIFQLLFPSYAKNNIKDNKPDKLLGMALKNTQERIILNKPVTIAYLYAVILWSELKRQYPQIEIPEQKQDLGLFTTKAFSILREQSIITAIPKRHAFAIKEIWEYQLRLQQQNPKKVLWLLQQRRFRAAFDFLQLRENAGDTNTTLAEWWETFQFADSDKQESMIKQLKPANKQRHQKRKKKNA